MSSENDLKENIKKIIGTQKENLKFDTNDTNEKYIHDWIGKILQNFDDYTNKWTQTQRKNALIKMMLNICGHCHESFRPCFCLDHCK